MMLGEGKVQGDGVYWSFSSHIALAWLESGSIGWEDIHGTTALIWHSIVLARTLEYIRSEYDDP